MSDLVNQAFEHNDSQSFDDLRKLIAADLIADGTGADEAVFLADKGLCESKAAYDIGNGNGSEQDIIENLIDRETARVSVWMQENGAELVEKGCTAAGVFIGMKLTPIFGPKAVAVCTKIGEFVGKKIGAIGTKLIDEGTRKIASYAKTLYNKAKTAVVDIAKKTISKLFG